MNHSLRTQILSALIGLTVFACARKTPTPETNTQDQTEAYRRRQGTTADGMATLVAQEATPSLRARLAREAESTTLAVLPSFAGFTHMNFFKFLGDPEAKDVVFVAPRIYSYAASDYGSLSIRKNADRTVTLTFPIVFVSGLRAEVPSTAGPAVKLPGEMRLTDEEMVRLRGLMAPYFKDKAPQLATLPGCPTSIWLRFAARDYEATPVAFSAADYCQGETPVLVSARIDEDDVFQLLLSDLDEHLVQVDAVYQVMANRQIARLNLNFNRAKVFEELKASVRAGDGMFYTIDATATIRRIFETHAAELQVQGVPSAAMERAIRSALDIFFTEFAPAPDSPVFKSCETMGCLQLNYAYSRETNSIAIEWNESTNTKIGQNYLTSAIVQAEASPSVRVGDPMPRDGFPSAAAWSNSENPIDLNVQIGKSAIIKVTAQGLGLIRPVPFSPVVSRVSRPVCTSYRTECESALWEGGRGERAPLPGIDPSWLDDRHDGDPGGSAGRRHCSRVCANEQDQWVETQTYPRVAGVLENITGVEGKEVNPFGLEFSFSWIEKGTGAERHLECPWAVFEQLPMKVSGPVRTYYVESTPQCPYFESARGSPVHLGVRNRQSRALRFPVGSRTVYWDGRVSGRFEEQTFLVHTGWVGTVSVVDAGFKTKSSTIEKLR